MNTRKLVVIHLTADDLNRIEAVAPKGVAAGDRYPADVTSLQQIKHDWWRVHHLNTIGN